MHSDQKIGSNSRVELAPDEKTSALLARVLALIPESEVSVGYLIRQLSRRSFGGLLIILAALGLLPGISIFAGLAMIVPGIQMALGFNAPRLPKFIRVRKVNTTDIKVHAKKVLRVIEWIERFVKPRYLFLSAKPMIIIVGVLVIPLSLVVMLPLPFSNFPPAAALLCLSLGIMERDGLLILTGLLVAAIALVVGIFISSIALKAVLQSIS